MLWVLFWISIIVAVIHGIGIIINLKAKEMDRLKKCIIWLLICIFTAVLTVVVVKKITLKFVETPTNGWKLEKIVFPGLDKTFYLKKENGAYFFKYETYSGESDSQYILIDVSSIMTDEKEYPYIVEYTSKLKKDDLLGYLRYVLSVNPIDGEKTEKIRYEIYNVSDEEIIVFE